MRSIKNTLLSLAIVTVIASSGRNIHVAADLTSTGDIYDGKVMYTLFMVGEIETIVGNQVNMALTVEFNTAKDKIRDLAENGTLTAKEYTCIMDGFYAKANATYSDFTGFVAKNLEKATITTEKYIQRTPTYWWDFYSGLMSMVANTVKNKELTSLYTAMDAKVEADIKSNASATTIIDKYSAFLTSANALVPTFTTKLGEQWTTTTTSIVKDFKSAAICPTSTTPSPTSVSTIKSPSGTTIPTSSGSETTSAPSEATLDYDTPEPTPAKAIATTTAPPAKSTASKMASTLASAAVVMVAFAATTLI